MVKRRYVLKLLGVDFVSSDCEVEEVQQLSEDIMAPGFVDLRQEEAFAHPQEPSALLQRRHIGPRQERLRQKMIVLRISKCLQSSADVTANGRPIYLLHNWGYEAQTVLVVLSVNLGAVVLSFDYTHPWTDRSMVTEGQHVSLDRIVIDREMSDFSQLRVHPHEHLLGTCARLEGHLGPTRDQHSESHWRPLRGLAVKPSQK